MQPQRHRHARGLRQHVARRRVEGAAHGSNGGGMKMVHQPDNVRRFFQPSAGQRCLQRLKKRRGVGPRPRRAAGYGRRFAQADQAIIRTQLKQDAAPLGLDAVGGDERLVKRYAIRRAGESGYSHGKDPGGTGACALRKSCTTSSNAAGCSRCTAWPASGTT